MGAMLTTSMTPVPEALRTRLIVEPPRAIRTSVLPTEDDERATSEATASGIPPELRERLFTPFSSGGSGTGLGLTIARALARASGGELVCVAGEPRYTVFRFTFAARPGRLTVETNGERIAS